MNKLNILFYAAAVTTAIAGIIHVVLGIPSNNPNSQILFIVGGIAQIFWIWPMIRRWGPVWYSVGLGGTIVFIMIWVITRIPDNFITGRIGINIIVNFQIPQFQKIMKF
jgi:predicted membrane channel-forming protein YqfA (hemolysin III family)